MVTRDGELGNMPRIMAVDIITDDGLDPTKAFADATWRANPRLSPSSFRVSNGWTLGKIIVDARAGWDGCDNAYEAGCNGVVMSLTSFEQRPESLPLGAVTFLELPQGTAWVGMCDVVILRLTTFPIVDDFIPLEQAVRDGHVSLYGVAVPPVTDLAAILDVSNKAAEAVWGRRKRSALKALMTPINLAEQAAFRVPCTMDKTEPVSLLELAARRDMLVLAERSTLWRGPWGEMDANHPKAHHLLAQRLPNHQHLAPMAQAWMVASSIPGVTGVVVEHAELCDIRQVMECADIRDVKNVCDGA